MLESTCNSLNITKNQKEDRLKETAGIAYAVIRDEIANPNRSQIIQELKELGFTELEASEALRHLEDTREIFVEDSSCLNVTLQPALYLQFDLLVNRRIVRKGIGIGRGGREKRGCLSCRICNVAPIACFCSSSFSHEMDI